MRVFITGATGLSFRKGVHRILEGESLVTCHPGINMIKSSWR
jgi:hypothetical protein